MDLDVSKDIHMTAQNLTIIIYLIYVVIEIKSNNWGYGR